MYCEQFTYTRSHFEALTNPSVAEAPEVLFQRKRPLEVIWPSPCSSRNTQSRAQDHVQAASEDLQEDGKTSVDSLCQCSITLIGVLPHVQREPPVFQFMPAASSPGTGHH